MTAGGRPSCYLPGGIRVESEQDDTAFAAWAAEQDHQPDGHPIIATIIGVIVILVGLASNPGPPTASPPAIILAGATGVALLVWGIAFAITIRRTSHVWKVGSFAILWALCLLAGLASIGRTQRATREDMATLTEIRIDKDGKLVVPDNAKRGPISQMIAAYSKSINDEADARNKAATELGIDRIADARAVTNDPELLRNCGRFAKAKPVVQGARARFEGHVMTLANDMEAANINADFKRGAVESLDIKRVREKLDKVTAISLEQLDLAGSLCTVLARRHWQVRNRSFAFTTAVDMNDYNKHVVRWNTLFAQMESIRAEGRASLIEGQRMINDAMH